MHSKLIYYLLTRIYNTHIINNRVSHQVLWQYSILNKSITKENIEYICAVVIVYESSVATHNKTKEVCLLLRSTNNLSPACKDFHPILWGILPLNDQLNDEIAQKEYRLCCYHYDNDKVDKSWDKFNLINRPV